MSLADVGKDIAGDETQLKKQKGRHVADLFFYLGIRAGTSAVTGMR
ncbi:hypothetical protein OHD62_14215 [Mesorhizobium sp. YC-39]|nr:MULTISPECIES: hypothetical protein [unclassified Mesorhizobium]MCV3207794.1 hypothetical protein [Mesorhizobium sp. YC-2]MCV3229521.1 hypothetical protein [Mesorhizobium sp. YC-39]